ncbi:MAG: hypothetical protein ACT4N8_11490 [Sphingosinicella sp.]|uniref:hypothetical protein n=1 Tax=Sphingosinicella sp. TaxID=1917971 RepID=UPI00403838C2
MAEHLTREELGRALGVEAGNVPLPVTARSLTRAEMRARERRGLLWLGGAYLLFGAVCLAVIQLAETSPTVVRWLPAGFAVTGLGLVLYAWLRLRRHRVYEDPGLAVEVGEDAVTISGPSESVVQPYDEVVVSRLVTRSPRNSVYFEGIVLETKLGPVALGDPGFAGGNAAAGAILRRLDELEQ